MKLRKKERPKLLSSEILAPLTWASQITPPSLGFLIEQWSWQREPPLRVNMHIMKMHLLQQCHAHSRCLITVSYSDTMLKTPLQGEQERASRSIPVDQGEHGGQNDSTVKL